MENSFNHMAEQIERQITELMQASANQQQFIDSFAHEIRTPLTSIIGYADYMQRAAMSDEERFESLETIMSEGGRMQAMATQLLELANMKKIEVRAEEIKISYLFEELKKSIKPITAQSDINFTFRAIEGSILGEYGLIFRLLVNIIDNAIKACNGSGSITVEAVSDHHNMILSVADNGKGMTAETITNITEPYYRADSSRNRKYGGTGLGLAISQRIADAHGAKLHFLSELGKGTTVQIIFTTL